jgi:transposase
MNAVGIDVSKGKSIIAVMRPFGEIVASPFEIYHTEGELEKLADYLKSLTGETRVIMEYTGKYFQPIARHIHKRGIFVSVVNPILVHDYSKNTIRRVKTDKKDAIKIANYGLDRWLELNEYTPEDDIRMMLKTYNRQYNHYMKLKVMLKNNLISIMDQAFPDINTLFSSPPRKENGHVKWIDFSARFWHRGCVIALSKSTFIQRYNKWCQKSGYRASISKAEEIYVAASKQIGTLPQNESTKRLITLAIAEFNSTAETLAVIQHEMQRLASLLPEYPMVLSMYGVGNTLGPQLIAEIGDVRRFERKQSLVAFAGIDAPPFQSGKFESHDRRISKRGSASLRKTLFQVMSCLLQTAPINDAVYAYLDKKRFEGKHFYVYMMAGANKFLRIYYARVKEFLDELEAAV